MVPESSGDGSELKKMIPWWRENFEIQKQRLTLFKKGIIGENISRMGWVHKMSNIED
jgi:hypothetical protein